MEKKRKNAGKKKILLICCGVLLLVLIGSGAYFAKDMLAGSLNEAELAYVVNKGDTTFDVTAGLKAAGAIDHEKAFCAYAYGRGYDGKWMYCNYTVKKGMGYEELCALLTEAHPVGIKVTIPEGKQVRQMAKIFETAGICPAADFLNAANTHSFDYEFLAGIDHENPLEGYLFPDTYYFEAGTEPDVIINAMLTNFKNRVYTQNYIGACAAAGYSLNDVIILASMVESEATSKADRENVAGVFLNRLGNPAYSKLQSCVTVEYALGIKKSIISYADTQFDSPYNTYMYPGLPVGPICCPGIESVEAVLKPAKNDYYYFQSDQSGKLYFAATFEEHAAIQKEVQAEWEGKVIEDYNAYSEYSALP